MLYLGLGNFNLPIPVYVYVHDKIQLTWFIGVSRVL